MHATSRETGLSERLAPFEALLRLGLFYKILIANVVIILIGAVAGTALTAQFVQTTPNRSTIELVGFFAVIGVAASALVNAVILRLALSPLKLLEHTAERVQRGELEARAPVSPLGDANLTRLTEMFNGMLDSLSAYQKQLQDVAARALHAQEEERKRIARELHDETAQTLSALVIRLRLARGAKDPETRDARLEEVRDEIVKAAEGIRRFAVGLRPPALDQVGVVAAISEHVRSLCETTNLNVEFEADYIDKLLPPDTELALYRIVQEALSNTVRHAGASMVGVRIEHKDDCVVVLVTDDGKGFDTSAALDSTGRGLGIFGMRERAAYVGGTVDIDSEPGDGTTVRVEIPVARGDDVV